MQKYFKVKDGKENLVKALKKLEALAKELRYTMPQIALAWAIANQNVSTVLLGFSRLSQIEENLKALELYRKWDDKLEKKFAAIFDNAPIQEIDFRNTWAPLPDYRCLKKD